jgi:hypothetical protein
VQPLRIHARHHHPHFSSPLKRIIMKTIFIPLVLLAMASAALANIAPTVVIQSAAMRPGTTLMDVVYRVNDPDDATVKTRALAFVDGGRSFANVLKPVTFVEGTAAARTPPSFIPRNRFPDLFPSFPYRRFI